MGSYEVAPDADGIHIQGTLSIPFVDVEAIRKCKFKVAVDAVNGAGSYIVPRLLEELGCEVVRVHCKPDGTFPRGAEPIPENLGDLRDAVKKNGCALGFAVDPDADRCALVDGLGQSIGEEYTLAIATEEVLSQKKGATCVNLSTSRMNEDVAEKYGCECSRAKVGEINVSLQMIEKGCIIPHILIHNTVVMWIFLSCIDNQLLAFSKSSFYIQPLIFCEYFIHICLGFCFIIS